MTTDYEKPSSVHKRLGSIRARAAELRDGIARMQRAEAVADLALSRAKLVWAEFKNRSKPS